MTTELRHETDFSRYTFWVDDEQVGLTDYRMQDGALDIVHTEIDPVRRGVGLGGRMVQQVLDDIRTDVADPVRASCPFVARFIDEHPAYEDLLTR